MKIERAIELAKMFGTPNIRVFSYYPAEDGDWNSAAPPLRKEVFARMEPFTSPQTYSNYLAADELDRDRVAHAFGSNYARLVEVKNEYDPGNLFRLNQNIKPSSPRVN